MQFHLRSQEKEFLDHDNIERKDLYRNLYELHIINKYLGGYAASRKGLKTILKKRPVRTVLDIGCGGGDSIRQLYKVFEKNSTATLQTKSAATTNTESAEKFFF